MQKPIFHFNVRYFLLAVLLFITEVIIALYVRDNFVRPYLGDYLVVILLYCAVQTFIKASVWTVAVAVLLFAYLIEALQFFHFVKLLGLQDNKLASIVLGTGFEWADLLAYTLGVATVVLIELLCNNTPHFNNTHGEAR